MSEYYKYSRAARNIVRFTIGMNILQKAADHLRTGAGDFPDVNNWRSNFAHNARKANKATLLRPESKRPLKSQIGRLYSGSKMEHTFVTVRTLCPGSVPAAQNKHDKKSRKRLYNHNITIPAPRQPWVLIDESTQKRLKNPAMVKSSRNVEKAKSGEKIKSVTVFPGKQKC